MVIDVDRKKIAEFCRMNHILKLSFFGSVIHDDFTATSDVDVLVEFHRDNIPGLSFFDMEAQLSELLGRNVDLNTPDSLPRYFRDAVTAEAEVIYEQT